MKRLSKKFLTLLLAAAMVFSLGGMTAFAAEADDPETIDGSAEAEAFSEDDEIATLSVDDEIATFAADGEYEPNYDWYNSSASSFEIGTAEELAGLSDIVNGTAPEDVGRDTFRGKTITLTSSINMNEDAAVDWSCDYTGEEGASAIETTVSADDACAFTPIGNMRFNSDGSVVEDTYAFEGTFDGGGYTISNLYVTGADGYLGLFGVVGGTDTPGEDGYGVVENLTLDGVIECTGGTSNTQMDYVGAVCGKLNAGGTILNVTNEALVDAPYTANVGGIVGFAGTPTGLGYDDNPSGYNTFVLCCCNDAPALGFYKLGGIVGENAATVKYCCNKGWVLPRRTGRAVSTGGIAGRNGNNGDADEESVIAYCYNAGMVTNNGHDDAYTATIRGYAGITGANYGAAGHNELYNCYNIGPIAVGYADYNSIASDLDDPGAAFVAVRNNYSLISDDIHSHPDSSEQETGIQVSDEDFKKTTNEVGDILTNLGACFVADTENINAGYPILFWQAGEAEPTLTDLQIATPPDKTDYDGEVFDPTGMVVLAIYTDSKGNEVKAQILPTYATYDDESYILSDGYTYPTEALLATQTSVTISFEGFDAVQEINGGTSVIPTDLEITPPTKTEYTAGETFDPTGMTFTVTFSDKSTKSVSADDVSFDPDTTTPLTEENTSVIVSYTSGGKTVTAEQEITVTAPSEDSITILVNGVASELTYETIDAAIASATEQTFTYGNGNSVTAQFVLLSDLIGIDYDFCSYTVTCSDGTVGSEMPKDTYLYKRSDTGVYCTAVNGGTGRQWLDDPTTIEVMTDHTWGEDVTWTWSEDCTSATASRTCTVCGETETVQATISGPEVTAPGERTVGKTTYTAEATFSDGTEVTGTKDTDFVAATGSIDVVFKKASGDEESKLYYTTINEVMDGEPEQTFHYRSHNQDQEYAAQFAPMTDLLDISEPVCCYYVYAADDGFEAYTPRDNTWMYYRDDTLIYRTAVDGSDGNKWVNTPTYIEVRDVHDWGDLTWTWSDDYTSAEVTATCQVDVCGESDKAEASEITHTTTATATQPGVTTYTATATLSDGTEVTGTAEVDTPAIDPTGYITIVYNGEESQLMNTTIDAAIEAAPEQTFTYTSRGSENTITKPFVLISDLTGIGDFCSYTVTAGDGYVTEDLPADTYLYWRDDDEVYRTAVNGGTGSQWANDPVTIEVITEHKWGDVTWTWNDDYTEATASRTCTICGETETAEASGITHTTTATATKDGVTTYTATAAFSDGTEVTGTAEVDTPAIDPDGSITVLYGNQTTQISNATIDAAIEAAPEQTFTYTSRGSENTVTKQFVLISDLTGIESFCSYTVTASDGYETTDLPKDTYLYWRDDDACYRTAVNGGTGSQWANDPVTIELIPHEWSDVTWTWADDDSSATASRTCTVCGETETADATITTETVEPTISTEGETIYTATATFADGTEVTAAKSETIPVVDPTDLEDEIAEAETLNESDYTADSWAALEDALANAQAVLADPDSTEADVEAAEEALKTAMDNLEIKDGLIKDSDGVWRLYDNGVFLGDYTGFATNKNGEWYVERGIVTFTVTDILKDKTGAIGDAGTWYYVIDSKVQEDFTGLGDFSNQYGWWYIVDGKVDFTRNSVEKNCNGWWYVVGGKVQFGFTGLANYENEYGLWYIENGAVNFNHNGVDKNNNGWYYVTGGKVNFDFTGLANHRNAHGWWYVQDGKVNFNHTGLEKNQNGWFYVKDSKVDFSYTGIATNQYGTWYISGGRVAFSYSGTVTIDGKRYTVKDGKVS